METGLLSLSAWQATGQPEDMLPWLNKPDGTEIPGVNRLGLQMIEGTAGLQIL